MSTGDSAARLSRMLAMVPYFLANPEVSKHTAARELGVSVHQLTKDLNQLWLCGLPGYGPGDLIDLDFLDRDTVEVIFSAGMERPLRLTSSEASVLLVALQALIDMPGVIDADAARRAIAKIDDASGSELSSASIAAAAPTGQQGDTVADILRQALQSSQAVWLRYYSASRDTESERIVDPIRVQVVDGSSYLQAWCRESEGVRLFRFDRIDEVRAMDQPARRHTPVDDADSVLALFHTDPDLPRATIAIDAAAAWVIDYYLIEPIGAGQPDVNGRIHAWITYGSPEWLTRFLLGFADQITVVDKPDVADDIASRARAALAGYGHS